MPEPATRSWTVEVARVSPGAAARATPAAISSAGPIRRPSRSSHSPVCTPARNSGTDSARALAQRTARAGPSKRAHAAVRNLERMTAEARERRAQQVVPGVGQVGFEHGGEDQVRFGRDFAEAREEALDLVEHGALVALPRQMVGARGLDDARAGESARPC